MYVRFNARYTDDQGEIFGIFWIAKYLYRNDKLYDSLDDVADHTRTWEILDWFQRHLPVTPHKSKSHNPNAELKALSWFKDSAIDHIKYLRELVKILERRGVIVEFITSPKPGYVVYEDEWQVFAEPFKS